MTEDELNQLWLLLLTYQAKHVDTIAERSRIAIVMHDIAATMDELGFIRCEP